MTDKTNGALKARAEAAFDLPAAEETKPPTGADEYKAKQTAERAKMARLRALRLAADAKARLQPMVKRKAAPAGNQ
jgi:hypothetical protein